MERIPLFPLNVVVFPGEAFGLYIFEERYLLMTEEVLAERMPIGIVLIRPDDERDAIEHKPEAVGTAVDVVAHERVGDRFLLQTVGRRRFRILREHHQKPYQEADVEWLAEEQGDLFEAQRLALRIVAHLRAMGASPPGGLVNDPVVFSHSLAASLRIDLTTKQRLLEAADARTRLREEAVILRAL